MSEFGNPKHDPVLLGASDKLLLNALSQIGYGRYVALSSDTSEDKIADSGYKIAAPRNSNVAKVVQIALILAPDSDKTNKYVYERGISEEYEGNSLELAYLLALISRSRKLRLKKFGDVWCTGSVDIKGLSEPFLKEVSSEGDAFIIKLENFLSQEESKLFILPVANISSYEALCKEKNVEVLSLDDFKPSVSSFG